MAASTLTHHAVAHYLTPIRYLEISGGGVDTIRALGALQQLLIRHQDFIDQLQGVSGCSAGGYLAAMLIMSNFNIDDVIDGLTSLPYHLYNADEWSLSLLRLYRKGGWSAYEECSPRYLEPMIERYSGSRDLTFREFNQRYPHLNLRLRVVDIINKKPMVLSTADAAFADMPLSVALWATMAIPFVHSPVAWKQHLFIDGGVCHNYSLFTFGHDAAHEVLGIRVARAHSSIIGEDGCLVLQQFLHKHNFAQDFKQPEQQLPAASATQDLSSLWMLHFTIAIACLSSVLYAPEEDALTRCPVLNTINIEVEGGFQQTVNADCISPQYIANILRKGRIAEDAWEKKICRYTLLAGAVACIIEDEKENNNSSQC